jgi:hypothetical protein
MQLPQKWQGRVGCSCRRLLWCGTARSGCPPAWRSGTRPAPHSRRLNWLAPPSPRPPRRTQLHMRTEYEDHPGFDERRHLLRLWLTAREGQPLDPSYYGEAAPGHPGLGIYRKGTVHTAPLDAE